jgi:diguanylate cyclase (GGDEF)-like protein
MAMMTTATTDPKPPLTHLLKELIQIGIALTSERDLGVLLERIVAEARRFTNAEAGTLFLREGAALRFAVVQNEVLDARLGRAETRARLQADLLALNTRSLAGYVATTGLALTLPDAYHVAADRPFAFNAGLDQKTDYCTRSVLVVPLQEMSGDVMGVLQLINARDDAGGVVPFDGEYEGLVRSLASQAAVALRNARLEELSFKDPLTGVFNRRYFMVRIEEEAKRHSRFGEPMSLVMLDLDNFKPVNDRLGHSAGDDVLREVAQVLTRNSRSFSIVTRYGGDEFAVLLVNTPRAGALSYAARIKQAIEEHPFTHGGVKVSVGVATLPDDVTASAELIPAADRALYVAKRART